MRYVLARAKKEAEADAYRIYLCDTLYFMSHNQAPTLRVHDFLHPPEEVEEDRNADEIIDSMKFKLERLVNK